MGDPSALHSSLIRRRAWSGVSSYRMGKVGVLWRSTWIARARNRIAGNSWLLVSNWLPSRQAFLCYGRQLMGNMLVDASETDQVVDQHLGSPIPRGLHIIDMDIFCREHLKKVLIPSCIDPLPVISGPMRRYLLTIDRSKYGQHGLCLLLCRVT